ncbi:MULTISPECIES: STAS domain-containing protein [Amycolatopsis]|uniref:STAS domain-containing protein n=1 Tax=Amycolatopsis TaxID=1813 RepID=UPI0033B2C49F
MHRSLPITTDNAVIIHLAGELDLSTIEGCGADLREVVARTPPPSAVVLDLRELTFLSACGLRIIREFALTGASHGTPTAVVARPGGIVRRVLDAGLTDGSVPVCGNLDTALAAHAPA